MATRKFSFIGALTKATAIMLFGYLAVPTVGVALAYASLPIAFVEEFIAARKGWW